MLQLPLSMHFYTWRWDEMNETYRIVGGRPLRRGYTTGSCAAGAAKAAAIMVIEGRIPKFVDIDTPFGTRLHLKVEKPYLTRTYASCCIVKDAGDDPDVTNGMEIYAKVSKRQDGKVYIDGGTGIGKITREGFWGKVGKAAINPVPREMIKKEVSEITAEGLNIIISAPAGEKIAKKTFNSNIGIEGGISIIGTKGIVEPMSEDALKTTIYLEIDRIFEEESREIVFFPGNYGEKTAKKLNMKIKGVKVSNFIGDALLYCHNKGFNKVTLVGHIGKLSKLSIGCFNTHSRICDVRIEAFVYYMALEGAPWKIISKIAQCKTSEEALAVIFEEGYQDVIGKMARGCEERIRDYVKDKYFDIQVILYSMDRGIL